MEEEQLTPDQQEALDTYNAKYGEEKPTKEETSKEEGTTEEETLQIPDEETTEEGTTTTELLAGKFKSAEDLEKAYKELESKLGVSVKDTDVGDPLAEPDPEPPTDKKTTPNLDMGKFKAEVFRSGKLGEASIKEMKKAGVPESFIESFVSSEAQVKQATINEIYAISGDKETYGEIIKYASTLSGEDKMYFNSQLQSGSPTLIKGAIKSLKAMYSLNNSIEPTGAPNRVQGGSKPTSNSNAYSTRDEMVEALKDPRWQTDRDYTNKVMTKVSRSNI